MNAGDREVVSNGRMSEISMNDYAPFEGRRNIITKYDAKQKQKHVREGIVFGNVATKINESTKRFEQSTLSSDV